MDRLQVEAIAQQSMDSKRELDQEMLAKERLDRIQNGGLIASHGGPSPEQYDYAQAARHTDFSESPEGGIDLPNRFVNYTQPVAGYDLQTGEQLFDFPDPHGVGRAGIEELREGVVNTVHGPDVRTLDGAIKVALAARQAGMSFEDVGLPFDREGAAVVEAAASSVDYFDQTVETLRAMEGVDDQGVLNITIRGPDRPVGEGTMDVEGVEGEEPRPRITRQTLQQDERWVDATRRMWEFYSDDPYPGEAKATNALVQQLAMISMNEVEMAYLFLAMRRGEMDADTAQALLYAYEMYDEISMFDAHVWLGGGAGLATSPLTYLSGFIGRAAYKAANRKGAMNTLRNALRRYLSEGRTAVATGAAAGAVGGAVGAGGFMAGEEATRQQVAVTAGEQEAISGGQVAAMGAIGAGAGLVLGGGLGGLLASEIPGGIGRVIKSGIDSMTGKAPYGEPVRETAEEALERRFIAIMRGEELPEDMNMGVPIEEGFYSRFNVALQRNMDNAFGDRTQLDPADILNRLDPSPPPAEKALRTKADRYRGAWLQGNEKTGIPNISQYEIESTGLRSLLEARVAAGEKISRAEIDAFMYARSPQLRAGVAYQDYRYSNEPPYDLIIPPDAFGLIDFTREEVASRIASTAVVSRIAHKVNVSEEVNGDLVTFRWKDPVTQEDRSITHPREFTVDYITDYVIPRQMTSALQDMDTGALVRLMNELDEKVLLETDPRARHISNTLGASISHTGDLLTNYQEMRLFIPTRSSDVNDIAADRFGRRYDELSPEDKNWVDMASKYTLDPASYTETAHFPLELNRLAHIRMQDVSVRTAEGNERRVLFVNEIQSDLRNSVMRHVPERQVSGEDRARSLDTFIGTIEDSLGPEYAATVRGQLEGIDARHGMTLKDLQALYDKTQGDVLRNTIGADDRVREYNRKMNPISASFRRLVADWELPETPGYQPMTEGWREAALAQIFHRAGRDGYDGVAFPTTGSQIEEIQNWRRGTADQHPSANIYLEWLPKTLSRKAMMKRFGISAIEEGAAFSDETVPPTVLSPESVRVYRIKPEQARASTDNMKPIYGAAGPVGAMQLLGQEDGETPDTP